MKSVLEKVGREYEFDLKEVNIESDENLKFKDKIPVLIIDGTMFSKYRVDETKLRKKLSSLH